MNRWQRQHQFDLTASLLQNWTKPLTCPLITRLKKNTTWSHTISHWLRTPPTAHNRPLWKLLATSGAIESLGYRVTLSSDNMFSSFDRRMACDRRTDRQMEGHSIHCAQGSNYRQGCRGFPRHWSLLSPALLWPKTSQPGILLSPAEAAPWDCLTTAKAIE